MPTTPSNLYAEQIYAEHPIALWTMDDGADYISLITEANRDLTNWTSEINGISGTVFSKTNYTNSVNQPFANSKTTKISRISAFPTTGYLYDTNTISLDGTAISIGFWIYAGDPNTSTFNPNISSIDVGYKIGATIVSKNLTPTFYNGWVFVSAEFVSTTVSSSAVLYVNFNFNNRATDTYLINGLSVGKYAQEFNRVSLGVDKNKIANISSFGAYRNNPIYGSIYASLITHGIKTDAYGFSNTPAYYLANLSNFSLFGKVTSTPLVYGSKNSTILNDYPGMIFPSFGFMNSNGKYNTYTFETWIKINTERFAADTDYPDLPVKIIGPVSEDGVYNENGLYAVSNSIQLKIGNKKESFFMGYNNRIVLLNIVYTSNYVKVLVNGETVINMTLSQSDLNSIVGKNDWVYVGAFGELQIDCVAIYNYEISEIQAKKHFVLGQGVQYPEIINTKYGGSSTVIDYPFAGYSNNLMYPNSLKWETGQFENIIVENDVLKFPKYSLPTLVFDNKDSSLWYADNQATTSVTLTYKDVNINLRPNANWSSTNGYLYFDSLNFTQNKIRGFYAIVRHSTTSNEQILFKFVNKNDNNYFQISINGNTIYYKFKYNDSIVTLTSHTLSYTTFYYAPPTVNYALIGIDIDKFASVYNNDILNFFNYSDEINVYVAGDNGFANTFTQPIESINFTSRSCIDTDFFGAQGNRFKLYNYVNANGIFNISTQAGYTDISSYGINPTYRLNFDNNNSSLNIAAGGYWQTNVPLSYFGKNVINALGGQDYVLDFMQYNIDSPKSLNAVSTTNQLYDDKLTTIKSFINFQLLNEGVTKKNKDFPYVIGYGGVPINNVIQPIATSSTLNYSFNLYQVGDDSIIYPPKSLGITAPNFTELAMTVFLQFDTKSIFTNPAKVRNLQLASQSLNTDTTLPNPIKTKLGNDIIPYTYTLDGSGNKVFNYKKQNPFVITKTSNPHLNLHRQNGITLSGFLNYNIDPFISSITNNTQYYTGSSYYRGLLIEINKEQNNTFNLDSIQISINPQKTYFVDSSGKNLLYPNKSAPVKLFELESKNKTTYFYLSSSFDNDSRTSGDVGKIYAVDSITGNIDENITYYWNGSKIKNPYVEYNRWGILGINFTEPLSFAGIVGQFRVVAPITFNYFSYYQYSDSKLQQSKITRPWNNVAYPAISQTRNGLLWNNWSTQYTWNDLLIMSNPENSAVDLSNLYGIYTGSNRYVTDFDGTKLFGISNNNNRFVSDLVVESETLSAE